MQWKRHAHRRDAQKENNARVQKHSRAKGIYKIYGRQIMNFINYYFDFINVNTNNALKRNAKYM